MKALGTTLFVIVLTMSPAVIVNAQTAVQPASPTTTATAPASPDVVTKSDLRRMQREITKTLQQNAAKQAAPVTALDRKIEDQTAQNKADAARTAQQLQEIVTRQEIATRQEKTQRAYWITGAIIVIGVGTFVLWTRRSRSTTWVVTKPTPIAGPAKFPAPEDLYGQHLSPDQVKRSLHDNELKDGIFTIDLPNDQLVFKYRAVVMPDGKVMAYFAGNERPVSLEHQQLRKIAKRVYGKGTGPLQPITLRPTSIRRAG